jgi:hypothetical protein
VFDQKITGSAQYGDRDSGGSYTVTRTQTSISLDRSTRIYRRGYNRMLRGHCRENFIHMQTLF